MSKFGIGLATSSSSLSSSLSSEFDDRLATFNRWKETTGGGRQNGCKLKETITSGGQKYRLWDPAMDCRENERYSVSELFNTPCCVETPTRPSSSSTSGSSR